MKKYWIILLGIFSCLTVVPSASSKTIYFNGQFLFVNLVKEKEVVFANLQEQPQFVVKEKSAKNLQLKVKEYQGLNTVSKAVPVYAYLFGSDKSIVCIFPVGTHSNGKTLRVYQPRILNAKYNCIASEVEKGSGSWTLIVVSNQS